MKKYVVCPRCRSLVDIEKHRERESRKGFFMSLLSSIQDVYCSNCGEQLSNRDLEIISK